MDEGSRPIILANTFDFGSFSILVDLCYASSRNVPQGPILLITSNEVKHEVKMFH